MRKLSLAISRFWRHLEATLQDAATDSVLQEEPPNQDELERYVIERLRA